MSLTSRASESWPDVRNDILARLDRVCVARGGRKRRGPLLNLVQIALHGFPIPDLPPPPPRARLLPLLLSSSPAEHSSQEADKENAPVEPAAAPEPGGLPGQIADQLSGIKAKLETFTADAPHTIQRLAELVLQPRAHYRALATYLHAVDRVVQVTSGTGTYPLPPAVPDMSALNGGGGGGDDEPKDPAATVTWSNPTTASLGSDEALGGALLTPIPWLTRRSPESNGDGAGAQIHSEGTETIEGPNGVGSIETVSVSVNGVPSIGHARGVTQGELLRQEQRAGVVPVSQLSRGQEAPSDEDRSMEDDGGIDAGGDGGGGANGEEDNETPHARGPEEIGVNDTGPQGVSTSYFGEDGMRMQGIDVEAAVGRRHDEEAPAPAPQDDGDDARAEADGVVGTEGSRTKREADQSLEAEAPKKAKEGGDDDADADARTDDPSAAGMADAPTEGASDAEEDAVTAVGAVAET